MATSILTSRRGTLRKPSPAAIVNTFRYYRMRTTAVRSGSSDIQLSELAILNGSTRLTGMTASCPNQTSATGGEQPSAAADNSTATKWFNNSSGTGWILMYDFTSQVTATGYRWATANDSTTRDPISWLIEGSDDGLAWTKLDTQTSYATTTSRQTYLPDFPFTSFDTALLPTALFDLDADSISGSNDSAVSSFPDVSGNARHFVQATSGDQPTLVTNAVNGRKAVAFAGKYMSNLTTGITTSPAVTLCAVIAVTANSGLGFLAAASNLGTSRDFDFGTGEWYVSNGSASSDTTWTKAQVGGSVVNPNDAKLTFASGKAFGTYAILTMLISSEGVPAVVYLNGTPVGTMTGRDAPDLLLNQLYLGCRYFSGGPQDRGQVNLARLRMYNGQLTSSQVNTLHSELGALYGITVS